MVRGMWKSELTARVLGLSTRMPYAIVLEDDAYKEGYRKDDKDADCRGEVDVVIPVGREGLRMRQGCKVGTLEESRKSSRCVGTVRGGREGCEAS